MTDEVNDLRRRLAGAEEECRRLRDEVVVLKRVALGARRLVRHANGVTREAQAGWEGTLASNRELRELLAELRRGAV